MQIRERGAELLRERADRVAAAQRSVQRVLEPDVRGSELAMTSGLKSLPRTR